MNRVVKDYLILFGIGGTVIALDGVKIGDGAIIGANSVVTKDVAP